MGSDLKALLQRDGRVDRVGRVWRLIRVLGFGLGVWVGLAVGVLGANGQMADVPAGNGSAASSGVTAVGAAGAVPTHRRRAERFLRGRGVAERSGGAAASAAAALDVARRQHAAMVVEQGVVARRLLEQSGLQTKAAGMGAGTSAGTQGVGARVSSLSAAWQPVGPGAVASAAYGRVSGRVTAVAIDPTDATGNTVYVGTTGGGVWKSVNAAGPAGSVSFVPLTDTLPVFSGNAGSAATASLSIGAVSVGAVPGGTVVLAGTGDTNDAMDSYYGSGLLRSADGGVTWTLVQGSDDGVAGHHTWVGLGFAGIAWSSTAPGLVVVALSDAVESAVVNAGDPSNSVPGLYYSTDAGVTWQMSTIMDGSAVVQRATPGGGGNAATAVVWNAVRQRFYAAVRYHGYYQSADGVTWTRLVGAGQAGTGLTAAACPPSPGGTGSAQCPIFRGALTVQPVTGDTFAVTVDANNVDQGVWQDICAKSGSTCSGAIGFSRRLGGTELEVGGGDARILQGDYNLALAAVSYAGAGGVLDTALYVGTVDVYKCTLAAGCSLRNTTNAANGCTVRAMVAPAQHAITGMAGAGLNGLPLVFVGNDGGVWRSMDGINELAAACSADDATHFDNLNGGIGSLAEVVSFAQHPTDAGQLLVGLGANGTAGTGAAFSAAPALSVWGQLSAGEGGGVAIDAANPLLWYVSTGAGLSVKACANGTGCTAADFAGVATVGAAQVVGDAALVDAAWMLDPLVPAEMLVGTCRVWRGPVAGGSLWSGGNAISRMFGVSAPVCGASSAYVRALGAGGTLSSSGAAQNAGATVLYAGLAGTLDGGGALGGHVFMTAAGGTAGSTTAWTDVAGVNVTNDVASGFKFNPGGFDVSSVVVDGHDPTGKTVYATVMGFAGNGVNAPHVYRSVDGGGHWLNISGNLPNAPANGLVVDPNDANTLYVAMDAGVYVTNTVASCATTNCWSVFGVGLPNSPVVQLAAAAGMSTGDGRTGELRVGTYGRGIWQIPLLTASSGPVAAMSLAPGTLTFAAQPVGSVSTVQAVTVTNTGGAPLVVSAVSVTGDFHTADSCVGSVVAVGASCSVQVSFLPSATGSRSGSLTLFGNVAGGQAGVTLSGTGLAAAAIVLNPITLVFDATTVGATSAAQNVTVSNTGGATSVFTSVSVSGDFVLTANTCGSSLAAGVGCTVAIAFKPSAAGVRTGTLLVVDDLGTQTVALSGSGVAAATDGLSPLALTFGAQQVGTVSAGQQVMLTNTGDVALTLIAAQITAGDFIALNSCGNSLNARSSCTIGVQFAPRSVGAQSGLMTVTDQFRAQTVVLNGMGTAAAGVSISPVSPVGFGIVGVGGSSTPVNVTITNNGAAALSLQGIAVAGDFAILSGSNTCGSSLGVGAACTLQVSFLPTVGGPRNGTLTVTDSGVGSPRVLALTGTGVDFALAANGSTSLTVANGGSAVFPLLVSSAANVPGTVVFTCAGAPAHSSCVVSPGSVVLGGTSTVSVTVLTQVAGLERPLSGRMVWWASLLPLGLIALRRRWGVGLLMLCLLAGCGSGRRIPGDGSGGSSSGPLTPSGSYTVVVSGTSVGLVRSVSLTLVVQ